MKAARKVTPKPFKPTFRIWLSYLNLRNKFCPCYAVKITQERKCRNSSARVINSRLKYNNKSRWCITWKMVSNRLRWPMGPLCSSSLVRLTPQLLQVHKTKISLTNWKSIGSNWYKEWMTKSRTLQV
jgi:hypothetical protein